MEDKLIATNRQARFHYTLLESVEAGIQLKGTEVKSIRNGKVSLTESFARLENGEIFLYNMHVAHYEFGNIENTDPLRPRKLLLHRSQIRKFTGQLTSKGLALIPVRLYFKNGIVKVELSLAKGKKIGDKRESIREREAAIELKRAVKNRR